MKLFLAVRKVIELATNSLDGVFCREGVNPTNISRSRDVGGFTNQAEGFPN